MNPNAWRPPAADTRLRWWLFYRFLPMTCFLVVTGLFFYLLFEPFYHPHAYLFFAAANYTDDGLAGSSPAQDMEALLVPQVKPLAVGQTGGAAAPVRMQSPDAFDARLQQLHRSGLQSDDILFAWISAQVVVRGDQLDMLCENCDPLNLQNGCYPLARLFDRLMQLSAGVKLVVLDPARTTYLPRLGIMANNSSQRIVAAVRATKDRRLWVVVANGVDQCGTAGGTPPRSVLAEYLGRALRGAADRNKDRYVDLAEVDRYLQAELQLWLQRELHGQRNQSLLLVWGGGAAPATSAMPELLPIAVEKLPDLSALQSKTSAAAASTAPPPGERTDDEMHLAHLPARLGLSRPLALSTDGTAGSAPLVPDNSKPAKTGSGAAAPPVAAPLAASPSLSNEKLLTATPSELLGIVWSLHDRLAASDVLRPVERAPHLWRSLQDQLIGNEMAAAAGDTDRVTALSFDLRRMARQLDDMAGGRTPQRFQPRDLCADLSQWTRRPLENVPATSLAMADELAQISGITQNATAHAFATELDGQLAKPERGDFSKWMEKQPPALDAYSECRLARRFAAAYDVDWDKIVLALQTLRRGEQAVAATLETGTWTRRHIERGDVLRREGQRLLLAMVRPSDASVAAGLLRRAQDEYSQALDGSRDVTTLTRAIDAALFDLPDETAWLMAATSGPQDSEPDPAVFSQFLSDLTEAMELVDHPSPEHLPEVRRVLRQFEVTMTRLRQPLASRAELSPSTDGGAAGKTSPIADPLLAADLRLRLRGLTEPAGAAAWAHADGPFILAPVDQNRRVRAATQLYSQAMRVVLRDALNENRGQAWSAAAKKLETSELDEREFWPLACAYAEALRDLLQELPAFIRQATSENMDLSVPAQREARLVELQHARRWLAIVDPRDALRVERPEPGELLDQARLYDLLVWQRSRLIDEQREGRREDALAAEGDSSPIAASLSACGQAARAIERQPLVVDLGLAPLEISGSGHVDLTDRRDDEFQFTVFNHRDRAVDVWLSTDFEPTLVEIAPRDSEAVYDENPARYRGLFSSLPGTSGSQPLARTLPTASLKMQPGEAHTVWMRAARVSLAGGEARVALRATTRDDSVRCDVLVALPRRLSVDMAVDGQLDTWQATAGGLALYPFPNSTTTYQFFLLNQSSAERKVGLEILRAASPGGALVPHGDVAAAVADEYLRRVGATSTVVKIEQIVLPVGGARVPIPFVPYVGPPELPPAPKPAAGAKLASEAPAVPEATPLSQTLIAVITDRATGRKAMKQIEILTQRPARYLKPRVVFDPVRRRAEIHVIAAKPNVLPVEGVHVVSRPQIEPPEGLFHAEATLHAGDREAILHVEVPRDSADIFPILLDVDGFNRAFRYEVPTHAESPTPLTETTHPGVRIVAPKAGDLYGPDAASVDTELEVDTAHGLLLGYYDAAGENCVEVGLDTARDRELDHKDTVRLSSDRQVDLRVAALTADGKLALRTKVSDLKVKLPPPAIKAARVNVLARLMLANGPVWSEPVEVVFDNQAPRMSQLHLHPGATVMWDNPLEVSVLATDNDLSGVATVEADFDVTRRGEFNPKTAVAAAQQSDGRWVVNLQTKPLTPGSYSVLVRATDRCGNASEYIKTKVEVTPKLPDNAKPKLGKITGHTFYGRFEKRPEAGVVVKLAAPKPDEPARDTLTDDKGAFTFEDVPPGEYKLNADVLLGGNKRVATANVKVAAPPAETPPVEMILESVRK